MWIPQVSYDAVGQPVSALPLTPANVTGLEEDYNGDDTFKTPRGVRGYELLGDSDFTEWKIQGNLGGENFPDKVRGPLNEGGLFVEREGAKDRLVGKPPMMTLNPQWQERIYLDSRRRPPPGINLRLALLTQGYPVLGSRPIAPRLV